MNHIYKTNGYFALGLMLALLSGMHPVRVGAPAGSSDHDAARPDRRMPPSTYANSRIPVITTTVPTRPAVR